MASFDIAVAITMDKDHEGGFQKNPRDRGNWTGGQIGVGILKGTNGGISAAEFPDLDIENLTPDEIKNAYFTSHYWGLMYSRINDQSAASKLFDLGVLFGVHVAVVLMQEVLQPTNPALVIDGIFGSGTLDAVNASDPTSLLRAYKTVFVNRAIKAGAEKPEERQFVAGWITRINS